MPKSKRRRKRSKLQAPERPTRRPSPKVVSAIAAEQVIARRLIKILFILAMIMAYPFAYLYSSYDLSAVMKTSAFYLFLLCMGLLPALASVQMWLGHQDKKRISAPHPSQADLAKYRRNGRWILSLSLFMNIVALIPPLHAKGYISKLGQWVPGKEGLGNKVSLAVAFGAGAIVSGVLGNLAYDIVKVIVRRSLGKH